MPKQIQLTVDIYTHNQYYNTVKFYAPINFTQAFIRDQVLQLRPELSDTKFQTQYFKPKNTSLYPQ